MHPERISDGHYQKWRTASCIYRAARRNRRFEFNKFGHPTEIIFHFFDCARYAPGGDASVSCSAAVPTPIMKPPIPANAAPAIASTAPTAKLLRIPEAASQLNICKRSMNTLIATRELAVVKIGRAVRFRQEDIDAFIARKIIKPRGWKGV